MVIMIIRHMNDCRSGCAFNRNIKFAGLGSRLRDTCAASFLVTGESQEQNCEL